MRDEWYVARRGQDGNKRYGPVSLQELRDLMDSGKVRGEDLVWREGMADWQRADQCAPLAASAPARRGRSSPTGRPPRGRRQPRPLRADRLGDRPRPYLRRRSSGTIVALIVGGIVLAVGLLACGGGFLYWMLNRGSAIKSAATTPYMHADGMGDSLPFGMGELYYTLEREPDRRPDRGGLPLQNRLFLLRSRRPGAAGPRGGDLQGARCCVLSSQIWDAERV